MLYKSSPTTSSPITTPQPFRSVNGNWVSPPPAVNAINHYNDDTIYIGLDDVSPGKRARVLIPYLQQENNQDEYSFGKRRRLNPNVMPTAVSREQHDVVPNYNKRWRDNKHDAVFTKRRRLDPDLFYPFDKEPRAYQESLDTTRNHDQINMESNDSCRALVPVKQWRPVVAQQQALVPYVPPSLFSPCRTMVVYKPPLPMDETPLEVEGELDVEQLISDSDEHDAHMDTSPWRQSNLHLADSTSITIVFPSKTGVRAVPPFARKNRRNIYIWIDALADGALQ